MLGDNFVLLYMMDAKNVLLEDEILGIICALEMNKSQVECGLSYE